MLAASLLCRGLHKKFVRHWSSDVLTPHLIRCIVYRRSTLAVHSFPSLRRFLTLAPACWRPEERRVGKEARSRRWRSPQNGEPTGKKCGGRRRKCGRGSRRKLAMTPYPRAV